MLPCTPVDGSGLHEPCWLPVASASVSPPTGMASSHAPLQQRPLAPVRPIPSQRWCNNFPKEEEEAKQ